MFITYMTLCLFASFAGLYQAHEKRSSIKLLKQSPKARGLTRALSYGGLITVLIVLTAAYGLEAALPIWLGLLSLVAIAALFLAAHSKRWHFVCGACAGLLAALASIIYVARSLIV